MKNEKTANALENMKSADFKAQIAKEEAEKKERLNIRFHNTIENFRQSLYGLLVIEGAKDLRGKAVLPLENDSEIYVSIRNKEVKK